MSSVEAVRDGCDVWWPWDQIFRYLHIMIALEFPSSDTSSTTCRWSHTCEKLSMVKLTWDKKYTGVISDGREKFITRNRHLNFILTLNL